MLNKTLAFYRGFCYDAVMLVATHKRTDRTVPVITVVLDNINTTQRKKFKCSICGSTVFAYWDTLRILLPVDRTERNDDEEEFYEAENGITEVECTHFIQDPTGRRSRCRTIYVLDRG